MLDIFDRHPMLNHLRVSVIVIDKNKRILSVNKEFEKISGYNSTTLVGKDYDSILEHYNFTQVSPILQSMKLSKPCCLLNYLLKKSNDDDLIVNVTSIPIENESKQIIGCCLLIIPKTISESEAYDENVCNLNLSNYGFIGESGAMHEISYLIKTVAPTDATVLILGETGTGKEIVANIIYRLSTRNNKVFKVVNCATLSENLLENELFGHEKGAYTGANETHKGIFETAMNGTVFLDEIGEISLNFQAKLLRVLESGEFNRIGSVITRKTNVRIIAATNRNLKKMIEEKSFREDLYYRLNIFPIQIPPLRERITDLPLLIDYFINVLNEKYNKKILDISEIALTVLFGHSFPGNVRELKNIIEHSYIKSQNKIIQDYDLPDYIFEDMQYKKTPKPDDKVENQILYLLKEFNGNKSRVAKALGISRKTLYKKLSNLDYNKNNSQ